MMAQSGLWYLALISLTSLLPAALGSELGFRRMYIRLLVRLFDWATDRLEEDNNEEPSNEDNHNEPRKSLASLRNQSSNDLITKEASVQSMGKRLRRESTLEKPEHVQIAEDCMFFMNSGVEAIIDDEVTQCFRPEQLSGWNLLARTTSRYQFMSVKLTAIWFIGVVFRWCVLMPWRVSVCLLGIMWMLISMFVVSWIENEDTRLKAAYWANVVTYRIFTRALGAIVNYHNRENLPKTGSICVANHTTVIDIVTLSNDRPYALIGQVHGGLLGWFQRRLSGCTEHVWFERSELRDRTAVGRRLRDHTKDPRNYPCLIFPEGTCINNTSVMQFKKGSFEATDRIYPVAIKYNPWFGDAFYNSSKFGMTIYLMRVFTSWAIVAEVYYLPLMIRGTNEENGEKEDSIEFANRCKAAIAEAGGLVDRNWDGNLKRSRVKTDDVRRMQSLYTEILQTAEEKLEFRRKNSENKEKLESKQEVRQRQVPHQNDDIDTRPDILPQLAMAEQPHSARV